MESLSGLVWVCALGVVAGTIGGVVGFGTSILLMPALVWTYGAQAAIPIMAIASIMANASRVLAWWRAVQWSAVAWYSAGAVPCAVLGAHTLLRLPAGWVDAVLGAFFIAMIPARRFLAARQWRLQPSALLWVGAGVGFLTGIAASTGPINTPFFLALGLVKGAYLSTEAMASLGVFVAKGITFHALGALPWESVVKGLVVGLAITAGSFLARPWVRRMQPEQFRLVMDAVLLFAGFALWAAAWRG